MPAAIVSTIIISRNSLFSARLGRRVRIDCYSPENCPGPLPVLLINDGQDLEKMPLARVLEQLHRDGASRPVRCVGIFAGPERKREYGTAASADYQGLGNRAGQYADFVLTELIPFVRDFFGTDRISEWAFAGFSLGGLSALDIGWHEPGLFRTVAVFSGSLWWRSLDTADPAYSDRQHRIMHAAIRRRDHKEGQRFFFECGTEDETQDRNQNGIIDSIDDTRDLIAELSAKGYREGDDICYLEIEGGRHDVATWARALPDFLRWAWPA